MGQFVIIDAMFKITGGVVEQLNGKTPDKSALVAHLDEFSEDKHADEVCAKLDEFVKSEKKSQSESRTHTS